MTVRGPVGPVDALRHVETPEGVSLDLPVAGPVPRASAWLLDTVIKIAIVWGLAMVLLMLGRAGQGLYLVGLFGVFWFYQVLFEVLMNGQTPGKRVMQIRVVHDDGTPVGWTASMIRNLLRAVDALPLTYAVGLIATLLHPDFKRLGDLAAGTIVIHDARPASVTPVETSGAIAPPLPLRLDEQRALVEFGHRVSRLTRERAEELAAIPDALAGSGPGRVARLLAMSSWVAGRR